MLKLLLRILEIKLILIEKHIRNSIYVLSLNKLLYCYLYYELSDPSIQVEKIKEEVKTADEKEIVRLMKEQEDKNLEISALKQELETTKRTYEVQCSQLETQAKDAKAELTQKSQEYEQRLEELRNKVTISYFSRYATFWYSFSLICREQELLINLNGHPYNVRVFFYNYLLATYFMYLSILII